MQITKVGRYPTGFDYAPESIEKSVARSLRRLHTTYLDVIYLHDVEFIADEKLFKRAGNHATALAGESEQYGLNEDQEGETYTDKDHKVLAAVKKLFELRDERGIIKRVGISGKCAMDPWNLNSLSQPNNSFKKKQRHAHQDTRSQPVSVSRFSSRNALGNH
jgi:diketogulonate reductase-like aldo/keto reductase